MNSFMIHLADGRELKSNKTLVMGILNATPDSFSDGGELYSQKTLGKRITQMLRTGADILDVGGESTRPGHKKVGSKEESERILPVIKTIRKISVSIPISVDTQKASVAEKALEAGAHMINDVSALSDPKMPGVVNKFGCSIILMRNQSTGSDVIRDCKKQFAEIVKKAGQQGIDKKRILLDPGLGFGDLSSGDYKALPGSDPQANLSLITGIDKYSLGLPVVIGASRKRFIGELIGASDVKKRLGGSLAAAMLAKQAGAAIVRVHDVAETALALKNLP